MRLQILRLPHHLSTHHGHRYMTCEKLLGLYADDIPVHQNKVS